MEEMEKDTRTKVRLYTGSYNAPVLTGDGSIYLGNGKGIQCFLFDEKTGELEEKASYEDVKNASWLTFSADGRMLYAVNELDDYEGTKGGALSSFAVKENGELRFMNTLPVMGAAPCHVNCDGSGRHVYTANYNGGNASSFMTGEDGSLAYMDGQIVHAAQEQLRPGMNPIRQEKPHVHSSAVNGQWLWITDLGTDEVTVYRLNAEGGIRDRDKEGRPKAAAMLRLPAGRGPRSLAFGKETTEGGVVYVSCELSNQIAVIKWQKSGGEEEEALVLAASDLICSLPSEEKEALSTEERKDGDRAHGEEKEENLVGGILLSPDGRYLYVGNRGKNSIGIFKVEENGLLKGIGQVSSHGLNPRGFQISPSGNWMIVANQDSDNLIVFSIDPDTGLLKKERTYWAGAVVCLQFADTAETYLLTC